ncbi:phosphatidate phosphatase LPIN [Enteropsectra breve]|nr:phosphatidate phosphatase LPIN [Enteropsectra breve]
MGVVDKIFSGVSGLYTNINPITLSGVNDVIVVKGNDGVFRCSPFQLRFSKIKFYNARSQFVNVYVNGELTDINMTITSEGDLFFQKEHAFSNLDFESIFDSVLLKDSGMNNVLNTRIDFARGRNKKKCDLSLAEIISFEPQEIPEVNLTDGIYAKQDGAKGTIKSNVRFASSENLNNSKSSVLANKSTGSLNENTEEFIKWRKKEINEWNQVKDDMIVGYGDDYTLVDCQEKSSLELQKLRIENLTERIFALNNLKSSRDRMHEMITKMHPKIYNLLRSPEYYAMLLNENRTLLMLLEALTKNLQFKDKKINLFFSKCMNLKAESSLEQTFNEYLTTDLVDPETIVVKLEGVSYDTKREKVVRFYMPYLVFSKLFFEIRMAKSKRFHLIQYLEKEYNKALGWNIFGTKQPLKRDIGFSLLLNHQELECLHLKPGKNSIVFKISGLKNQLESNIYLWDQNDKIIISDIDGTITKSDVKGHIYTMVGIDWTHAGVAALYSQVVKNGYKIMYLSSRSLGQSSSTRSYIQGVSQDSFSLPDGPIILNPDGLLMCLYRELIIKRPEEFKIQCLENIRACFVNTNPFFAGFGNKISDVYTYKALKIPENRIYTINHEGKLLAEYSKSLVGTYHTMNEFIDNIFPSLVKMENKTDHYYSDFMWWK